jgi:hypothetical protein
MACDSQRDQGLIPTTGANEAIFVDLLEKDDRRGADKPKKLVKPRAVNFDKELKKRQKRTGHNTDGLGDYSVTKKAIDKNEIKRKAVSFLSQKLKIERALLQKRVRQLKADPVWYLELKSIAGRLIGAQNSTDRAAIQFQLEKLLERSNKTFGDWRKVPAQTLYFSGGS